MKKMVVYGVSALIFMASSPGMASNEGKSNFKSVYKECKANNENRSDVASCIENHKKKSYQSFKKKHVEKMEKRLSCVKGAKDHKELRACRQSLKKS